MIDELQPNGVPIDVEKMFLNIGVSLKKGHHKLNGKELLGYARFRHDPEGDFGRVKTATSDANIKTRLVNFNTVAKLPKVAGILKVMLTQTCLTLRFFQTGISFGIRGDKMYNL